METWFCAVDINNRRDFFEIAANSFDDALNRQEHYVARVFGKDALLKGRTYAPHESKNELMEELFCIDNDC